MLLFDPQLVLLGPAAFVILDTFGHIGYLVWLAYPTAVGSACAAPGLPAISPRRSALVRALCPQGPTAGVQGICPSLRGLFAAARNTFGPPSRSFAGHAKLPGLVPHARF